MNLYVKIILFMYSHKSGDYVNEIAADLCELCKLDHGIWTDFKFFSMMVHDISDYNATYNIPLRALRLVSLRLTRNDSAFAKSLWSIFYWFEFANLFLAMMLEIGSIVEGAKGTTFEDVVQVFSMTPCVGYLFLAMSKSYTIEVHRPVYENLMSELRDMWPREALSDAEYNVIKTSLRHINYVIQGYFWCNIGLLVVFLSPPFLEMAKMKLGYNGIYYLPFFYWLPYDPMEKYFLFTLLTQSWQASLTIGFMLSSDLLFCIFLSHITMQFDLLSIRIKRLIYVPVDKQLVSVYPLGEYCKDFANKNKNKIDSFDDNDWADHHQKELTEIIERHRALIRLAGDVENMFSFTLLANFFNSSIIICFCGFCSVIIEKWNELVYKSFMTTALSQTWLLCWYGQRLLESSERVADSLYESGWYRASQKIKNTILIMLHRSQKNVKVTTFGFSVISLASYTTIIKTSWSYFTLLLNLYKK